MIVIRHICQIFFLIFVTLLSPDWAGQISCSVKLSVTLSRQCFSLTLLQWRATISVPITRMAPEMMITKISRSLVSSGTENVP